MWFFDAHNGRRIVGGGGGVWDLAGIFPMWEEVE